MNEKNDDIAHPDIVSKPLQTSDYWPNSIIRHRQANFGGDASRLPILVINAELEIDAVKEGVVVGVGTHEEFADFESIESAVVAWGVGGVHREIKPLLKPVGDAVSPFDRAVVRVIGNDCARESRGGAADGSEIVMDYDVELTLVFDFGVVDPDFVGLSES
jgi:hypothetical protein